jgi:DNA polymerase-3 subunit gamma/tau
VSYQVLARKWRPHSFKEVVGQEHVLTALSNGLALDRVHHAYLFSGTRGVGKTTIARILAKSLNCDLGVTATPCGTCENCIAIDEGRFVDLLEIDAASRTKVDDTREMLDNVQYKPAVGRYKVYLIDEVHMLSKHSFNALLKTLEEPPEFVKFLLATTDPQKLPITVLSRCLQFHLKAIQPKEIEDQLSFILQKENAHFDQSALKVISKAADGSMRDALSLTDQALAYGAGTVGYQAVLKMLGTIDNSHLYYLLHFIVSGNIEKVFEKVEELAALGVDFATLHQELATICHEIALQQFVKANSGRDNNEKSQTELLADKLQPEEIQLYYQIALQGYKDFSFAPNGKIALEMTVMRLLAFKPANQIKLEEPNYSESHVLDEDPVIVPVQPVQPVQPVEPEPVLPVQVVAPPVVDKMSEPIAEIIPEPRIESNMSSAVQAPMQAETQSTASTFSNTRNMLRSHRLKREGQGGDGKKHEAIVEPTFNPIQTPTVAPIVPTVQTQVSPEIETKPYIQEPILPAVQPIVTEVARSVDNQVVESIALPDYFVNHEKIMVNVDISSYVSDKLTDHWSLVIKEIKLVGLVQLLAKNCVMKQVEKQIVLTLKPAQQHLLNSPVLAEQLEASLQAYYGAEFSLYIEVGHVAGSLTAFESELLIYQQYLQNAKQSLANDQNIHYFASQFDAKVYENSIIPL